MQGGYLRTDKGGPVEAFQNVGSDRGFDTDCHGFTFADGKYWIDNNQVNKILSGDNYTQIDEPKLGDVAVYRENKEIVHSGIVRGIDEKGGTMVESEAGVNVSPTIRSGAPGPNGAWPSSTANVIYYRKEPREP
jgi:hypothetical protein